MNVHCVTCTCSAFWELVSHHLLQALSTALGVFAGLSLWGWLWGH